KNKYIWVALLICTALVIVVYLVPQLRLVLGLEILPPEVWGVSVICGLIPLFVVQGYRVLSRKYSA
ncbi:MAG TPA: cation transporting ATPase C-terminal domain-containing protein, partial [Lunatimonas sp.]|nr:cation transporting ATPase C-terminal domain-containing protein [Lunatimonas sp.]